MFVLLLLEPLLLKLLLQSLLRLISGAVFLPVFAVEVAVARGTLWLLHENRHGQELPLRLLLHAQNRALSQLVRQPL